MANPGDILDNPVTGHHVKFLTTTAESNGDLLRMEYTLKPGAIATPWHIHLEEDEYFEGVAGVLSLRLFTYDNIVQLQPGERAEAPRPFAHQFFNASTTEPVTFIFERRPAGQFERFLEIYSRDAHAGRLNSSGVSKDLLKAALLYSITDTYLPGIPGTFQRFLLQRAADLARLLGRSLD